MKNLKIRDAARQSGVKLWQIAEKLGITDGNLSRRLRRELPDAEQERLVCIIAELAAEQKGES